MAVDVLRGLHYLHTKRIVHLDLKTPNILLTRHGQAKLADVGLSKVIRGQDYLTQLSVIGAVQPFTALLQCLLPPEAALSLLGGYHTTASIPEAPTSSFACMQDPLPGRLLRC